MRAKFQENSSTFWFSKQNGQTLVQLINKTEPLAWAYKIKIFANYTNIKKYQTFHLVREHIPWDTHLWRWPDPPDCPILLILTTNLHQCITFSTEGCKFWKGITIMIFTHNNMFNVVNAAVTVFQRWEVWYQTKQPQ